MTYKFSALVTSIAFAFCATPVLANQSLTITNLTNETYEVSSVDADIGNMYCGKGKNADFDIPPQSSISCKFTTTHGITDVGFHLSLPNNILDIVKVLVNNLGTQVFPPVNPVAHVDGGTLNITGSF